MVVRFWMVTRRSKKSLAANFPVIDPARGFVKSLRWRQGPLALSF